MLVAIALPLLLQAQVHVIDDDGGPGVDFTDLPAAVAAALPGDVLLVREGTYSGFRLDGIPLSVVADLGASVEVLGPVGGRNLDAPTLLQGLDIAFEFEPVRFDDCAGVLMLEDLNVDGGDGVPFVSNAVVTLSHCRASILSRCLISGLEQTGGPLGETNDGLRLIGGSAAMYGSVVSGPRGAGPDCLLGTTAGDGGTGIRLINAGAKTVLLMQRSVAGAGWGGSGDAACSPDAGSGGIGAHLTGSSPGPQLFYSNGGFSGGQPGTPAPGGAPGESGEAELIQAGAISAISTPPVDLEASSPVREGDVIGIQVLGESGTPLFVAASLSPDFAYTPGEPAALHLAPPVGLAASLGPALPIGAAGLSVPVPELGAGIQAMTVYWQAGYLDPAGVFRLGPPAATVLLDAAYGMPPRRLSVGPRPAATCRSSSSRSCRASRTCGWTLGIEESLDLGAVQLPAPTSK